MNVRFASFKTVMHILFLVRTHPSPFLANMWGGGETLSGVHNFKTKNKILNTLRKQLYS